MAEETLGARISLTRKILFELREIGRSSGRSPGNAKMAFPSLLPVGDGKHIHSNDKVDRLIVQFGRCLAESDVQLRKAMSDKDRTTALRRAFGKVVSDLDFDIVDDAVTTKVDSLVRADFVAQRVGFARVSEHVFGASFLTGLSGYETQFGPIRFESRELWLCRLERERRIDAISARRLRARWSGKKIRKRQYIEAWQETAVADAVGDSQFVCSVTTFGMSDEVGQTKALLVGRLALTSVALMWAEPSSALRMMRLRPDGTFRLRKSLRYDDTGLRGSNSTSVNFGNGQWVTADWPARWDAAKWRKPVELALTTYVDSRVADGRSRITKALFSALWWFHEACREPTPLIATVKFASALDALAGGRSTNGILDLIEKRIGLARDKPLFKNDKRSTKYFIEKIYDKTRSRMLHGSHQEFGEDFSELCGIAEMLSRTLIILSGIWMAEHPHSDDFDVFKGQKAQTPLPAA